MKILHGTVAVPSERKDDMTFAEKLRTARTARGLSQAALAKATGISLRTIQNYELDARMPKSRDTYARLAEALGVEEKAFLDENTSFVLSANEKYGSRGVKQAWDLVSDFRGLAAGGEIASEDLDEIMRAIQEAYWDAKQINRKYTNKRYTDPAAGEGG